MPDGASSEDGSADATPVEPEEPGATAEAPAAADDAPSAGDPVGASDEPAPSDAFQALGGEPRTTVLRTLADGAPLTFSDLHDATDIDTSAGFSYHLRQLDGQFVRQREDERYELTAAGREAARAIRTGVYTESVDRERIDLEDPCPFCGETDLAARVADNVTRVDCTNCGSPLLELSLPPSGYATRETDSVPAALDAYHRRRIGAFADGVCPDCGGAATGRVESVAASGAVEPVEASNAAGGEHVDEDATGTDAGAGATGNAEVDADPTHRRVRAAFGCAGCGADLRCPVALTLLDHPAVVAFYHDHGEDVRERPLWNVGPEWAEWLVSRDPWCVLVRTKLDGDRLELYVAADGAVVDYRRTNGDDEDAPVESADDRSVDDGEAAPVEEGPGADEGTAIDDEAAGDGAPA